MLVSTSGLASTSARLLQHANTNSLSLQPHMHVICHMQALLSAIAHSGTHCHRSKYWLFHTCKQLGRSTSSTNAHTLSDAHMHAYDQPHVHICESHHTYVYLLHKSVSSHMLAQQLLHALMHAQKDVENTHASTHTNVCSWPQHSHKNVAYLQCIAPLVSRHRDRQSGPRKCVSKFKSNLQYLKILCEENILAKT